MLFKLVLICVSCLLPVICLDNKSVSDSGPYKIIPTHMTRCKDPKLPYTEATMVELYMHMKKTVISGNVTIVNDLTNYMVSIEDFYYDENGRRQLTFQVKRLTCQGKYLVHVTRVFGIKMDRSCTIRKGVYPFTVDFNKLEHIWTNVREYGRMVRRMESFTKSRTTTCYEYYFEVLPLAKN